MERLFQSSAVAANVAWRKEAKRQAFVRENMAASTDEKKGKDGYRLWWATSGTKRMWESKRQ
jgi:hypothetical protein